MNNAKKRGVVAGIVPLSIVHTLERSFSNNYFLLCSYLKKNHESFLLSLSHRKLEKIFSYALQAPGYTSFLQEHNHPLQFSSEAQLPITSKKNYVKQYSYEQRCVKGFLPEAGVIDESSGTTGKPINWVRNYAEEGMILQRGRFAFKYLFPTKKKVIVLSAWSAGPWSTGLKFYEATEHFALVKQTDADIKEITQTLQDFGTDYHYIISGYPLFLQYMLSVDFAWEDYSFDFITGGEGHSPFWVATLRKRFPAIRVYSGYGCSDVDVALAFETPAAQEIRYLAAHNKKVAKALFGRTDLVPMLFQYNPLHFYVHNLPNGEIALSALDKEVVSPKIKYNIHDFGAMVTCADVLKVLKKHVPAFYEKVKKDLLYLPFIYVFGRTDGTLSFDGSNVYPQQLEYVFSQHVPNLVHTFTMAKKEFVKGTFFISVELNKGAKKKTGLDKELSALLLKELPKINRDFKETLKIDPLVRPVVEVFAYGTGPFAQEKRKHKYIV